MDGGLQVAAMSAQPRPEPEVRLGALLWKREQRDRERHWGRDPKPGEAGAALRLGAAPSPGHPRFPIWAPGTWHLAGAQRVRAVEAKGVGLLGSQPP